MAETEVVTTQPTRQKVAVRIETLNETHFAAVVELRNQFVGARKAACGVLSCACCPESQSDFSSPYRRHPENLQTSAVAVRESDGAIVGFVQMSEYGQSRGCFDEMLHTLSPHEMYIDMISVRSDARGQGVGSKLMKWCEEMARQRNAHELTLAVVNGNPARRLYERVGFVAEKDSCCDVLANYCVTWCFFGCPHSRCGATEMIKKLE